MFLLHTPEKDLDLPEHPVVETPDGFAWATNERLRACHRARVNVPAQMIDRLLDGSPVMRALTAREIVDGSITHEHAQSPLCLLCAEDHAGSGEAPLRKVFPSRCPVCRGDHWHSEGYRLLIAGRSIHTGAIHDLLTSNVTLKELRELDLPTGRKRRTQLRPGWRGGLPVREPIGALGAETLRAQLAFAIARR
jgi:hypothetical protein